ncbi:MAG: hypothetical protein NTU43_04465 [Bacteroidetes bacterium]|nr:hypothetical protein [Bacteroidota bacterium]
MKPNTNYTFLNIELKVVKLLKEHEELKKRYLEVLKHTQELEQNLETHKNTIANLVEKNKLLKIASEIDSSGEDKKELKLKINQYIRELDECIRLLSD